MDLMVIKDNETLPVLDVFNCPLSGSASVEASAGTGKTWAICGLYLRLLVEAALGVEQILVVTFTNAATAELRTRIRDRLATVLHALESGGAGGGDPFVENFLRSVAARGGETAQQAPSRLRAALLSFEEAAIFTIHGFCQRALGEVPFAAVQPFRLEVETDDGEMIREAAADYWRRIAARYEADELRTILDGGLNPEWLAREFKRLMNRPTARLLFPNPPGDMERSARRVLWLKRIILRCGPHAVRAAKRRRRVISYPDMLYNLYEALTGGRLPWLAEALRARFPAALIDEFQDTDPLQFAIFRSLYFGKGTIFLVGDPKQAIYSFRSADLHTYLAATEHVDRQWTLRENQRSEPGLIDAVNAFFGAHRHVFVHPRIRYRQVVRGGKPLRLLQGDPEPRPPLSVWLLPPGTKTSPQKVGDAASLTLKAMSREMSRLLAGGRRGQIKIGTDPLQPRDIAVLVRTRAQGRTVKLALARQGIASVDITELSVFAAPEAEEMERVLRAVSDPADGGLVRAALATVLLGRGSRELAELNAEEETFRQTTDRLEQYRRRWQQFGFAAMWRKLMADEQVAARLLPLADGERRLTNIMHLMELAAAAGERIYGTEGLLQWLSERRSDPGEEEAAQLRLESDENLVQIVTKHRAKGREWPIVFCPFIWRERGPDSKAAPVYAYHDGDRLVLDYTGDGEAKKRQEEEQRAERVRLIYVALTRAVNRCYLAAGPFWQPAGKGATEKAARRGILNWIIAGNGESPGRWEEDKEATVACIHQKWRAFLQITPGVGMLPWPEGNGDAFCLPDTPPERTYHAQEVRRLPGTSWKLASYSSLSAALREETGHREPEDRDYDFPPPDDEEHRETAPGELPPDSPADILNFPAGITAGHCLHTVFERIDFRNDRTWEEAIAWALTAYPPDDNALGRTVQHAMIRGMLAHVLSAPLPGGFCLGEVGKESRLPEMEFAYPVAGLTPGRLNSLGTRHGRCLPRLGFEEFNGYLRGFIDLVFTHGEKWFVLDWKSNHLGFRAADYDPGHLTEEMFRHAYEWQALIYLTALHRYLRFRLPGYDYEKHIGGILYLFVRGIRPAWPGAGIWYDLPPRGLVEELSTLLAAPFGTEEGDA